MSNFLTTIIVFVGGWILTLIMLPFILIKWVANMLTYMLTYMLMYTPEQRAQLKEINRQIIELAKKHPNGL